MQSPERLRSTPALRDLVRETSLSANDLVLPLFLNSEKSGQRSIKSMPGVSQWSVEASFDFVAAQVEKGIRSFILFGIPSAADKTSGGEAAWDADGPVPRALRAYRKAFPQINLMADTCYCEYTDHGHCGPMDAHQHRHGPATLQGLGEMARCYAEAGANIIAPSGMVDGMVGAIRRALDESAFSKTTICSYAVKYASSFYGPFREAAENAPSFGDRRSYQMDPANRREALREAALDVQEGADLLLVKPGMPYLDIVREVADQSTVPVGVYQVSGEYSMMKAAAAQGWLNEEAVFLESLLGAKRAGASFIISYWAPEAADRIKKGI